MIKLAWNSKIWRCSELKLNLIYESKMKFPSYQVEKIQNMTQYVMKRLRDFINLMGCRRQYNTIARYFIII